MNLVTRSREVALRGSIAVAGGASLIAASPARAHHPMGGTTPQTFGEGLLSGLGHPVIGMDHLAFLVAAILLSAALQGTMRFVVPLAFVGATVAGTVLHLGAAAVPMTETLVALSVVIGAVLAVSRSHPGALGVAGLFAVSGVFHGYAYGEAIVGAGMTPLLAYLAGFALIQYAVIALGVVGFGKLAARSAKLQGLVARGGGVAALVTGSVFLGLSLA